MAEYRRLRSGRACKVVTRKDYEKFYGSDAHIALQSPPKGAIYLEMYLAGLRRVGWNNELTQEWEPRPGEVVWDEQFLEFCEVIPRRAGQAEGTVRVSPLYDPPMEEPVERKRENLIPEDFAPAPYSRTYFPGRKRNEPTSTD